jgi:hypothetical protein
VKPCVVGTERHLDAAAVAKQTQALEVFFFLVIPTSVKAVSNVCCRLFKGMPQLKHSSDMRRPVI